MNIHKRAADKTNKFFTYEKITALEQTVVGFSLSQYDTSTGRS